MSNLVGGPLAVVTLAGVIAGCSAIRHGGAPERSFDVDTDLEQLARQFAPSDVITDFYNTRSEAARNKFITGQLTMTNIRYIQFVRQMTSERQLLDSAADMLSLVGQMNAERKKALIPILTGIKASLEEYPLTTSTPARSSTRSRPSRPMRR